MKSKWKRLLSLILTLTMVAGTVSTGLCSAFAASKVNGFGKTKVVAQKNYTLVPGVTETDVILNDSTGDAQVLGYMTNIAKDANVTIRCNYSGYYDGYNSATETSSWSVGQWGLSTPSKQAEAYEKATGDNVIFATNGDYFNMQTGQPAGPLFLRGVNCNPDYTAREPYFAVLKDGTYAIREAGSDTSDVAEAIGGLFICVRDGQNVAPDYELYPVNTVGIRADGSVFFFLADGRQYPNSVGMTRREQADFMIAQGAVMALHIDGGGSASVLTKREGEGKLTLRNSPSDGAERSVPSTFLIVANAPHDGVFDHATVEPNGEFYTPGAAVAFSASGVDAAGGAAELPQSGLSWALADESANMGAIDAQTGVFTSNGTLGEATAVLSYNGKAVGQSTITVAEPDELYFGSASVSLDFGERSSLGLHLRANDVQLNFGDGGLKWTVASKDAGVADSAIGTVANNVFTAGSAETTLHGTVTASYTRADGTVLSASVNVEIGKMPVVAFDFEPINGVPQTGAHFHWGKSNYVDSGVIPGYTGSVSEVQVATSGGFSGNPTYASLTAPFRFTGNYDCAVPAADIFRANGYSYYLWPNNSITAYGVGSCTTTTAAAGGQVRFGDYSLEMNYDYASYDGSANANFYLRYCGDPYYIEGIPNQLGVWVYADASAHGYSLYADIAVWNGSDYTNKNLALQHGDGSVGYIDWEGWMYCYADMSSLKTYYSAEHPMAILPGRGLFWLSYQPGRASVTGAGRYAGTLYFDNYRFVYGTDMDDLDNPEVSAIAVNGTTLNDDGSTVIDDSTVEIRAFYDDAVGANASGVDAPKTMIQVDGSVIACDSNVTSATTRLVLDSGRHSIQVTVYDKFGNYGTKTSYFTVRNGEETTAVLSGADTVTMGSNYELALTTAGQVAAVEFTALQLNSDFGAPTVTFADGWTGDYQYVSTGFKKAKLTLSAQWTGTGDAPADARVATLSFQVPTTLDHEIDFFTYQVMRTVCTRPDGTIVTSAQPYVKLHLSAYYQVQAAVSVSGYATMLTVTDPDGNPAVGVEVLVNGTSIGQTDANGQIAAEASKTLAGGSTFTVAAKNGTRISFTTTVTVMSDDADASGKPVGVALSAGKTAAQQVISWLSSVSGTSSGATVQFGKAADLADAQTVSGTSRVHAFQTSKQAARINVVTLDGLEADTTYYYRAGDGNDGRWSDIASFRTAGTGATSFFVIGDTQMNGNAETDAAEIALLRQVAAHASGAQFGLQTGDYIDNGGNYEMWAEMQSVFGSCFGGINMIHTLGNHEYYGDANGDAALALFGREGQDRLYYSVEYGNVYIAVVNYNADLSEAMAWLVQDAKSSSATWKVLSIHQPPYYTNVNGGSERFQSLVPAAVDEAGIQMVFSGHDHAYARTQPMTGGAVDEKNGAVYLICGDLGEKSRNINYAATDTPEFHFAKISQDYSALVLTVNATEAELTVTAKDADGTVVDTYTMKNPDYCAEHEWTVYDRATGLVSCGRCGRTADPIAEAFSGLVRDRETGKQMMLVSGVPVQGWYRLGSDRYYFDAQGLAVDGEQVIDGITYQFDQGRLTGGQTGFVKKGKATYYYQNGEMKTGWVEIDGKWHYFATNSAVLGQMRTGATRIGGILYTFDADGTLLKGSFYQTKINGIRYYWAGQFLRGWQEIDGATYYFHTTTGTMYTGVHTIDGKNYEFADDGKLIGLAVRRGFYTEDGYIKYYREGELVFGWQEIDDNWYYFGRSGYAAQNGAARTGVADVAGMKYTFDDQGHLLKGVFYQTKANGIRYYWAGQYLRGWQEIDGATYYFGASGTMATGTVMVDGEMYDFTADGKLVGKSGKNGLYVEDGCIKYYEGNAMQFGWKQIGGYWYYFAKSNYAHLNGAARTGVADVAGMKYTFDDQGRLLKGAFYQTKANGIRYYWAGQYLRGWQEIDGATYYFGAGGTMATGTVAVDGEMYDFAADGKLIGKSGKSGLYVEDGCIKYYKDNAMQFGWKQIDGYWYYFAKSNYAHLNGAARTGVADVAGMKYTFDDQGRLLKGAFYLTKANGIRYYWAGQYLRGWQEIDGATYYFGAGGTMATGTQVIDGKTCTFDDQGKLISKQ